MNKKYTPLLTTFLLASAFNANALGLDGNPDAGDPGYLINRPIIANDDYISLAINTYVTAEGDLSGNDRYGTTFTFNGSWSGQYGQITKSDSNGEFTYELFGSTTNDSLPDSGVGVDRFQYTYANAKGDTATAWLIIDIHADQSRAPIARDDYISTIAGFDTTATGNVGSNDLYGSIFTLAGSWNGQYGVINSFDSAGEFVYTLLPNTNNASLPDSGVGYDKFTYTYANVNGLTDTAQLIVEVKANSIKPVAKDDYNSVVVNVSSTAIGNVGINDLHGDTFRLDGSKKGEYGLLTAFTAEGDYIYELFETTNSTNLPEGGATERFEYTYATTGANGFTDTAFLIIDVSANPTTPEANDDHNSTIINVLTSASGNVGDNDRYGSTFTLQVSKVGQYGALTSFSSSGDYVYELFESTDNSKLPATGEASENFRYTYENENGISATAWLVIDVEPNPNQPIANDDYISTVAGVYTSATGNVSSNDRYGSLFTLDQSWVGKYGLITSFDSAGEYTYELFEGTDNTNLPAGGSGTDRFQYTYANTNGLTDTAFLIVDVSTNTTLPIARDDYNSTVIGALVSTTGNVTDNDRYGTSVTLNGSRAGAYGSLTSFLPTGEYVYTLPENAENLNLPAGGVGTDRFQYTYANAQGLSSTAVLIIDVSANPVQPKAPIANSDYISTVIGTYTSATGNVSSNDFYGTTFSLDVSWVGQYGSIISFNSDGEFVYELFESTTANDLPDEGVGIESFTYTYANDKGLTDTAQIIIDVRANPSLPIANDDYISTVIGTYTTASGNVGTNDFYGSFFSLDRSWIGEFGAITLFNSDGEYTYALFESTNDANLPEGGVGLDEFEYTYTNDKGFTDTAKIIIDVRADPSTSKTPIANDDLVSVVITAYPAVVGNVRNNDLFGTIVTFNQSSTGKYGFLSVAGSSGDYSYQLFDSTRNSSLPETGVDTEIFAYTLTSTDGSTAQANLIIDVNADPAFSGGSESPVARDDNETYISNKTEGLTGNVIDNDSNGDYVLLVSPPSSIYGRIVLQSTGVFDYELYETSLPIIRLKAGEVVFDEFEYQYLSNAGETSTAKLKITIIGNPIDGNGDTIFENPDDEPYDNVDVEFNDRSAQATPLNSGRNIKGHLHDSGDKDWYFLSSEGNEIITLEVCPKGLSCFNKKSWVLYVFDSDLLTPEMEERFFTFRRWVTETGSDKDLLGNTIITRLEVGTSNHMYLAYRSGFFDGALIGIVDPCFDALNSVDIGVGDGPRNYLIAVSSPLQGSADDPDNTQAPCGAGSVALEKPELSAAGLFQDSLGRILSKSYETTVQYISVFPNSDDQYAIKITSTGLEPLLSDEAAVGSATFDASTGTLAVPKVRVGDQVFQAKLKLQDPKARSAGSTLKFILSGLGTKNLEEVLDIYRATYNPDNQQVLFPRVTDTSSGIAYSVIMKYHAASKGQQAWFEVISIKEIK